MIQLHYEAEYITKLGATVECFAARACGRPVIFSRKSSSSPSGSIVRQTTVGDDSTIGFCSLLADTKTAKDLTKDIVGVNLSDHSCQLVQRNPQLRRNQLFTFASLSNCDSSVDCGYS
jgi:hypothetical protein